MEINNDNNSSKSDERFYTPRAQASTARSTGSYGTPRSYRSSVASSSDSDYATPRNIPACNHKFGRTFERCLIPPRSHQDKRSFRSNNQHFRFDQQDIDGDEEQGIQSQHVLNGTISKRDIDNIFSFTRHGRIDEVDTLLRRGVPPDIRDENGNTILIVACQNNNKALVKVTLRHGGTILLNASNLRGNTPLHFCFKYGNTNLANYLISKGADRTIQNRDGKTCEDKS